MNIGFRKSEWIKAWFLPFFFLIIISCKERSVPLPMEKEKLIRLIEDIYVAEAMAESADLSVRDSVRSGYMTQVANHHGMKTEDVQEVMRKLSAIPDSLHALQGIVLDTLRARQINMVERKNIGQ